LANVLNHVSTFLSTDVIAHFIYIFAHHGHRNSYVLYIYAPAPSMTLMLRYLGSGARRFALHPVPLHCRADWEFFVVVRGRCAAILGDTKTPIARERSFWVFPPETAHGWTARQGERCHVAVFHFVAVPPLLERIARASGYLQRALSAPQARRVAQLARELQAPFQHFTEKSQIEFEKALLELTLLALEPIPFAGVETQSDHAVRKVESSLRWYSEHMAEDPKLKHVAVAVHISPSHLRRLFWQVRNENPLQSFTKARLHRAMDLLSRSDAALYLVARQCGFSSTTDFCRVFKSYNKISPHAWRRTKLGPYPEPTAKG
jgi:AraC family transcriptional regulator